MKIQSGICLVIGITLATLISGSLERGYSGKWSVKVKHHEAKSADELKEIIRIVEKELGANSLGQIGELVGHYLFDASNRSEHYINEYFSSHDHIDWHKNEVFLTRSKRRALRTDKTHISFSDPLFPRQWHLRNDILGNKDCDVDKVWDYNVTGRNVVVAIVDDGVEWRHPDLRENYCSEGSIDLNDEDDDPSPSLDADNDNKHGTRCAGEVAAVPNAVCGIGIAYGSKFSAIKVLDGPTTDATEAVAFNKYINVNDIYSCSWGPEDDGKAVDGPHELGTLALKHGVVAGRQGFGSIYVVASGNGGDSGDNCNYDGYAASIYTITIGAIDEVGGIPPYAEECASMFACTVSSGSYPARSIVTTDWSLPGENSEEQCTFEHTGTSAATPLAAGMIALMLEVRPCLTWRDIQHIITLTAVPVGHGHAAWSTNNAGLKHSSIHGFGILDAWRLVNAAKVWKTIPWLTSFVPDTSGDAHVIIPCCHEEPISVSVQVTEEDCHANMISTLEHVLFKVNLDHFHRGNLQFELICPSGTTSVVPTRRHDDSSDGLDWTFSTVKCWGESPIGTYTLTIRDTSQTIPHSKLMGILKKWTVTIYGSLFSAKDRTERVALIKSSYDGRYLKNYTVDCPLGHDADFDVTTALSDRTIKLVSMISCFLLFWAFYYVFEIAICGPEKDDDSETAETSPSVPNHGATEATEFVNPTFVGDDGVDVPELVSHTTE